MYSTRIVINKSMENRVNGKPVHEDVNFYECWAELLQLFGSELYNAINVRLENTAVFKVRYCKKLEELRNKEDYSVKCGNDIYKLYYADFTKYPKKYVLLKCNLIK